VNRGSAFLAAVLAAGCATDPNAILVRTDAVTLSGAVAASGLCSDYLAPRNCVGGNRPEHHGVDFGRPAGTEVLAVTHGTVVKKFFNECAGHEIVIKTQITGRLGMHVGPIHVHYAHVEPLPGLDLYKAVKPGEVIGKIIPLRKTVCYGSREHVHLEMRIDDLPASHFNPHPYWLDGPGQVTCFKPGMVVPPGKIVAPVRCVEPVRR